MDDDDFEDEARAAEPMNLADVAVLLLAVPLVILSTGAALLDGLQGVLDTVSKEIDRRKVFQREGLREIEALARGER